MNTTRPESLHETADAYNNKETTDNYVKARPSYPKPVMEYISNNLGLSKDSKILDLAAGTGKFTQLLAESGFNNITAVEPGIDFRVACTDILESFKSSNPNSTLKYQVLDGIASSIPVETGSLDAVFIAQAFHWFDSMESIKEISRVLKTNGILFMVWNDLDKTSHPMIKDLTEILHYKYYDGKTPQYISGRWKVVFEQLKSLPKDQQSGLVSPNLTSEYFRNDFQATRELVIQRFLSTSFISILDQDQKQKMIQEVNQVLNSYPDYVKENETFILPYKVEVQWTRKLN